MVDREREELEEGLNAATAEAHAAAVDEELSIGLKSKEIVRTAGSDGSSAAEPILTAATGKSCSSSRGKRALRRATAWPRGHFSISLATL